jgi:hypothetical protein
MRRPSDDAKPVDVDDFRKRLETLRRAWDRFFQGVDRVPPVSTRDQFTRELHRARLRSDLKSTDRFRLQQVQQRLNSYGRLWDRNMRAIEAGTFKMHLAKMERAQKSASKVSASPDEAAFSAYAELAKKSGMAVPSRSDFLENLAHKRKVLEAKHGHSVRFHVQDNDGRPSLRVLRSDDD